MAAQEKKILMIYNPRAGMTVRRPKAGEILREFGSDAEKTDVMATAYPGHAGELAARFGKDYDTVVCCGGDGTLNEVVSGLRRAGAAADVGYIPFGSTNDFASNVGIPVKMRDAVRTVRTSEARACDVADFNDRSFTYIASFGPGVSVSYSTPQRFKNVFGYSAYMINGFGFHMIPTLRALKPKHIRVEYDGSVLEDDFYFGTVTNSLSAAGMFRYDKDEVRFNDGKFEVTLIRRMTSPMQMFSLLQKMGRHEYDGETMLHFQASRLHFRFEKPEIWTLDGESSGEITDADIRVRHNALRLRCPDSVFFEKKDPA